MISGFKTYLKVAWACKTPAVLMLDREYKIIPTETLKAIAKEITEQFTYINDISDCDDAALLFKASASRQKENGVGMIYGKTPNGWHAWNLALCEEGIVEVEPQTAGLGKRKGYKAWMVII